MHARLLVLYNGLGSIALALFVAFVLLVLFSLGLVPGFPRMVQAPELLFSVAGHPMFQRSSKGSRCLDPVLSGGLLDFRRGSIEVNSKYIDSLCIFYYYLFMYVFISFSLYLCISFVLFCLSIFLLFFLYFLISLFSFFLSFFLTFVSSFLPSFLPSVLPSFLPSFPSSFVLSFSLFLFSLSLSLFSLSLCVFLDDLVQCEGSGNNQTLVRCSPFRRPFATLAAQNCHVSSGFFVWLERR